MKNAGYFIALGLCLIDVILIGTYQNIKHSDKNISQIEQNDNKNMLVKKKADAYHNGPDEINSIEDVPKEFYRHHYYLYRRPEDGKCVFCSDYIESPDRILLDVEDDTFFYFVCSKEIADKILEIHKSNGGPGSGWK